MVTCIAQTYLQVVCKHIITCVIITWLIMWVISYVITGHFFVVTIMAIVIMALLETWLRLCYVNLFCTLLYQHLLSPTL